MKIEAVLFDADGVVQNPVEPVEQMLRSLIEDDSKIDGFVDAVFAAEQPCLTGGAEFVDALAGVLIAWGSHVTVEKALGIWTNIKPEPDALALVESIRARGIKVALATNQQFFRANYMKKVLGYDLIFDHLFYSCDLGLAKPDPEYFTAILKRLDVAGENTLFLDDHSANVEGARSAGLHAEIWQSGTEAMRRLLSPYKIF